MTVHGWLQHPTRSRTSARFAAIVMVACSISACGDSAAAPESGGLSETPNPPSLPSAFQNIRPSPSSGSASLAATIGEPADDGARIISVEPTGDRIRDLWIESPAVGVVEVRLLLPNGFDVDQTSRWPTLYLLHGSGGFQADVTKLTQAATITAADDLLVVIPDGGENGFYSDWWNGGHGGRPMWETFHLTELPRLLERNWRAGDRRAVAGISMGGMGAMVYAARRPGLFLGAASFSGVLDPIGGNLDIGNNEIWGDPVRQASVWQDHDPVHLAPALNGITLYVSYGNGEPGPFDGGFVPADDLEGWIAAQNETFVNRLRQLQIPATVNMYGAGSHSWPYWERELHRALPLLAKAVSS